MSDYSVIVIGAGISGLKATADLCAKDVGSVVCIESRDRIGGRLNTLTGLNGKYDIGGSWHHDTLSNGLFLEEMELPENERAAFVFDDEDTACLIDKEIGVVKVEQLECLKREFEKYVEMKYYESLDVEDVSYFRLCVEFCYKRRQLLTDEQLFRLPQLLRHIELWHGVDWYTLSGKWSGIEHNGRNALVLHYDKILARIAKPIYDKIRLSESVTMVKKLLNGKYEVITDKGKYFCDYCIVTVPQSVLTISCEDDEQVRVEDDAKLRARISFEPPLNEDITEALTTKSSFGSLGKVVFEFDSVKWSDECSRVLIAHEQPKNFVETMRSATDLDTAIAGVEQLLPKSLENSWKNPVYFLNLAKNTNTASLVALIQQPVTEYVETLTTDEVELFFRPVLNKLLNSLNSQDYVSDLEGKVQQSDAPILKNIITSNWSSDPFSLGAYSACKPGDDPMDLVIALNVGQGNLRFAGEHTIMDGAGCAYGAWESGKREANYILEKLFTGSDY
ncbi:unnamed protein product [Kluyveromyces dobzhanskii CBS 2104]|uniref:WGS project CCBQ000000000 data, contig 00017 n=1 Tax=Kluyveromyces dobzhanskii CBS 2104 TaxID=1427455 RepID=A0A0A8L642_9SACH|nr:unnamed protein product [Kluyveromyces dobzhanskii CBS 2104]